MANRSKFDITIVKKGGQQLPLPGTCVSLGVVEHFGFFTCKERCILLSRDIYVRPIVLSSCFIDLVRTSERSILRGCNPKLRNMVQPL